MSMNVKADNMSFGLLQRNEKLYAIGKSMEGMKPDESKKLVNGRICDPSESVFKKEIQQNVKQRKVEFSASDLTRCNNDYSDDKRIYILNGVEFTASEMQSVNQVFRDVVSGVSIGELDYKDYAKMGMAENMLRSYGKEYLSEEKAEAVNKAATEYFDQLINNEFQGRYETDDAYYAKRGCDDTTLRLIQTIRDYVANGDLPDYVKWTFLENMGDGRNSRLRSASDRELANTLRERFADLNWEDEKERQDLFEQYKKWMRPAYLEWFRAVGSKYADEELQNDINNFMKQYDKIKKTIENAGAAHVNIQI